MTYFTQVDTRLKRTTGIYFEVGKVYKMEYTPPPPSPVTSLGRGGRRQPGSPGLTKYKISYEPLLWQLN